MQKNNKMDFPTRGVFDLETFEIVKDVFNDSWENGIDFGFQGKFENLFTESFNNFQGGGFSDAVSSGTGGIYVALQSLGLPENSDILISPITNPGSVSPILLQNMNIVIVDSAKNSPLIDAEQFLKSITKNTKAAILTHTSGFPINMNPIMEIAKEYNIKIIEDCSQAHGAEFNKQKVGTFGDIAIFSTMYSKTLAAGGSSGLIYTKDEELYWKIRSFADRGKDFQNKEFDQRRMDKYLFPALNFNSDEISCAIGYSQIKKLKNIILNRFEIIQKIDYFLKKNSKVLSLGIALNNTYFPSVFHCPIYVNVSLLNCSKIEFAQLLQERGIWLNPHHYELVEEWEMLEKNNFHTPNAKLFRDSTFNLLLHENLTEEYIQLIFQQFLTVEKEFLKDIV